MHFIVFYPGISTYSGNNPIVIRTREFDEKIIVNENSAEILCTYYITENELICYTCTTPVSQYGCF